MKKLALGFAALVILSGCSCTTPLKDNEIKYANLDNKLVEVSKRITGFYMKKGETVPADFNEAKFLEFVDEYYKDDAGTLKLIKEGHTIKARQIGKYYSVMFCNVTTGVKLLEDMSCTWNKVDIRYDGNAVRPCEFEKNWESLCNR